MDGRRQSSIVAAQRIRTQLLPDGQATKSVAMQESQFDGPGPASAKKRALSSGNHESPDRQQQSSAPYAPRYVAKRPRTGKRSTTQDSEHISILHRRLFGNSREPQAHRCTFPANAASGPSAKRLHSTLYHRPLLLLGETGRRGRRCLLEWYDGVSEERSMPWRKPFDPEHYGAATGSRAALAVRAYEVWISEIMLQQTRVAVVKDYWTRWMERWPTMVHLAAAHEDDVTSAWRGLGYYSRAKRILDAARLVVQDPARRGLLPQTAKELEHEIPGVGRYTAGAISAIAFGNADCMVDGNVYRVLSRQLGIFGNVKSNKTVVDLLWAAAQALVEAIALEYSGVDKETGKALPSDGPGRWGQALMELGSTVCTPRPNCVSCPIKFTCRALEEGKTMAVINGFTPAETRDAPGQVDMEDICRICSDWNVETSEHATGAVEAAEAGDQPRRPSRRPARKSRQTRIPSHAGREGQHDYDFTLSHEAAEIAISHAQRFPMKVPKKAVREEQTVVCVVRRTNDGCYLIQKRPETGLLAGLWELPSQVLPVSEGGCTEASRRRIAQDFVAGLFGPQKGHRKAKIKHTGHLGSVPWVFSHLKLTMHVHNFQYVEDDPGDVKLVADRTRWADAAAVEEETMGTGMRHCWKLVVAAS